MVKKIDCKNLPCPEPVLKTKEALEEIEEGILEVELNSLSSIANVKRFATSNGLYFNEKKDKDKTVISIVKGYNCEIPHQNRSFFALFIGAIVSAVLASSCCLAPLLFLIFGVSVGSLSFLSIFAPYHKYFTIVSTLIIGYLWFNYFFKLRKRPTCSGNLCKNYLKYLIIGTIFVFIMITYPYWAIYVIGG